MALPGHRRITLAGHRPVATSAGRSIAVLGLCLAMALSVVTFGSGAARADRTVLLGASSGGSGDGRITTVDQMQTQAGRRFDFVRVFESWNSAFPTAYHNWLIGNGQTMLLSVKASRTSGGKVLWRDIANAAPGSEIYNQIVTWAQRVRNVGAPVWFSFNHEPEAGASQSNGTAAEYIAAWRKVVSVFRAESVTNVKFVLIMTAYSFKVGSSDRRQAAKWYPGDDYVDYLAADGYNWSNCRGTPVTAWQSLEQVITPFRNFGLTHPDKPLLMAEFGTVESGGNKAAWLADAAALFTQPAWSQFIAIGYFNRVDSTYPNCKWPINSSTSSLEAFRRLASDPFYGGTSPQPPTPPTPPTPPSATVVAFVVAAPGALTAGEAAVRDRLLVRGMVVRAADDDGITAAGVSDAGLVIISSSVDTAKVGTRLRDVAVPVLVAKPWLFDDMGMTGRVADTDYGTRSAQSVVVADTTSPMVGGASGTVGLTARSRTLSWGRPVSSATVVATAGGAAALFSYLPGATLADGRAAPGCRVAFPLYQDGPTAFTTAGWSMFDATATWAAAGC